MSAGSNLASYSFSTGISVKQIIGYTETTNFLTVTSLEVSLYSCTSKLHNLPKLLTESKNKIECDSIQLIYGEALVRLIEYANLFVGISSCYNLESYREYLLEVQKLESDCSDIDQRLHHFDLIIMAVENVMVKESIQSSKNGVFDSPSNEKKSDLLESDRETQGHTHLSPRRLSQFFDSTSTTSISLTKSKFELQSHRTSKPPCCVEVSTVSIHINDDLTTVRINHLNLRDYNDNKIIGTVEHVAVDQFNSHLKGNSSLLLT